MAVVMVNERDDRESVIGYLIVDDDDDRRQHQMKLTESVDESDDVNVSAIAILIEIDDDVVSVMVSVRIDVMMTMSMLTMMMMMMMVVTARRMPAVVPSSRHLATRGCPCMCQHGSGKLAHVTLSRLFMKADLKCYHLHRGERQQPRWRLRHRFTSIRAVVDMSVDLLHVFAVAVR